MKSHIALLTAALVTFPAGKLIAGQASKPASASAGERPEAEMVAKGKALFALNCSHCHGINMVDSSPVVFDLRKFPHNDKARFVHSVSKGKNGRMPSWGDLLTPDDIDELWAYVKTGGAQ